MRTVELPRSMPILRDRSDTLLVGAVAGTGLRIDADRLDARAHRGQLAHHVLVAALDVPRVAQKALTLGAEGGDDERGPGPDVGNRELGSTQTRRPVHDRVQASFDGDARAHLELLAHVPEAVLVHVLGDHAL